MIRKPLRILIVEDEPLARQRLYTLLHMAPGYKVVASAADGRQAVSLVRQHHPEIMLLDIQLPGLNGFEVLSSLRDDPTPPAVILLTAHGDHALRAFDAQVVDYLLKPFTRERLLEALERARAHCASEDGMITDLEQGEIPRRDRIAVRSGTRSIVLPFEEIYYAIADNVHCHIFAAKERARISESLASLHTRLPQDRFARISRFAVVNLAHISAMKPISNGDQELHLTNGTALTLSRTRRAEVVARLKQSA